MKCYKRIKSKFLNLSSSNIIERFAEFMFDDFHERLNKDFPAEVFSKIFSQICCKALIRCFSELFKKGFCVTLNY